MKAWGVATVDIHLSDRQYIRLLEAGNKKDEMFMEPDRRGDDTLRACQ